MKGVEEIEILREESCTSVTLCTKNSKLTALRSKQAHSFEKPATTAADYLSTPFHPHNNSISYKRRRSSQNSKQGSKILPSVTRIDSSPTEPTLYMTHVAPAPRGLWGPHPYNCQ